MRRSPTQEHPAENMMTLLGRISFWYIVYSQRITCMQVNVVWSWGYVGCIQVIGPESPRVARQTPNRVFLTYVLCDLYANDPHGPSELQPPH
jgi:hypothetical protein